MKYNYRILLTLLLSVVISTKLQYQVISLSADSYFVGHTTEYSIQAKDDTVLSNHNLRIKIFLPQSFQMETLQCECTIADHTFQFRNEQTKFKDISWKARNPMYPGIYLINVSIEDGLNQTVIFTQTKKVSILNKIRIGDTGSIGLSLSSSSYKVAEVSNYTFVLTPLTSNITANSSFALLFPQWSPIESLNPGINNGSLRCTVDGINNNCSIRVEFGGGFTIVFQNNTIFPSGDLNIGNSTTLRLLNIVNPSSTKPITIRIRVGSTFINQTLVMTQPATASSLSLSSITNLTGVEFNTNINFFGNLYYDKAFSIEFSNNVFSVKYNNITRTNFFNITGLSQSAQSSSYFTFPSYFTIQSPLYQSNFRITITSYFDQGSTTYYIETITQNFQVYPNALSTSHSDVYLYTNSTITFNITLSFRINQNTILLLTFQNDNNKLNCTNCTADNKFQISVGANQTFITLQLHFIFKYFESFSFKAELFLNSNSSSLSSTQSLSISSFCGTSCKTCSSSNPLVCTSCFSFLESGKNFYYYSNTSLCYQNCPSSTYAYSPTHICVDCPYGCNVCDNSISCISCKANYTLASNGTCISVCGLYQYMNTAGVCEACSSDCVRCSNFSYCFECNNQTYLSTSHICRQDCLGDCRTCDQTRHKCTSCLVGYLYEYQCYSQCPAGTVTIGSKCQYASNILLFPFLITMVVLCIGLGATKFFFKQTDIAGLMMMVTGICEVASAIATSIILLYNFQIFNKQIVIIGVGLMTYIICNIAFTVYYVFKLRKDQGLKEWAHQLKNKITLFVFLILSGAYCFKIFRGLYSKFMQMTNFSCVFSDLHPVIPFTNLITVINYLTFSVLSIVGTVMVLALSPISYKGSQGYYFCIELIIIEILGFIFLILDFKKPDEYFQKKIQKEAIDERKQVTLENIQTDYDNSKIEIKTKSKSPKKEKSPTLKKTQISIPTATMKGFKREKSEDKSALGIQRKSLDKQKDKKGGKGVKPKQGKTSDQEIEPRQFRRGNRFNRKKRSYDTGSNESFDIYLDFDHEPKSKQKDKKQFRKTKNYNYRSTELKPQTKPKLNPMADIYVGFLNSESDINLNNSIDTKKQEIYNDIDDKPKVEVEPIKIVQKQDEPQIIINLDEPVIKISNPQSQIPKQQKQEQIDLTINKPIESEQKHQKKEQQQQQELNPIIFSKTEGFQY